MTTVINEAHVNTKIYRLWIPTMIGLLVVLAWDASGWDIAVAKMMGNTQGFYLADSYFLSAYLHTGARNASLVLAAALIGSTIRPWGIFKTFSRRELLWAIVTTLLCALLVSAIKRFSHTSCPWDMEWFGGTIRYVSHWSRESDGGPGNCFPAGHASSAFAFVPYYFLFAFASRPTNNKRATTWLIGVCTLGMLLGFVQQLRGAHFTSHTLWTAWLCWSVAYISWLLFVHTLKTSKN